MRYRGKKITTLAALLDAVWIEMGSRKYSAKIHYFESIPECRVEEFFDDGKGHSGAITSDISEVEIVVFEEARTKGYITGVLKPGYVSKTEFVMTANKWLRSQAWDMIKEWREKDYP